VRFEVRVYELCKRIRFNEVVEEFFIEEVDDLLNDLEGFSSDA
jgi:hypothetical protein